MKNNYKFSIIIPILNVEEYLVRCLDSVINQTHTNYECLLMCDDSVDNSEKIAKEYANKDIRFKHFHKSNSGLSGARNYGVENCNGDYILFLDSDDFYEDDLLEKLNNTINGEELIRFQVREVFDDHTVDWNQEECSGTGIEVFNKLVAFHFVENAWAYCYETEFYKRNKFHFMEGCIAEDYGLLPLVIALCSKMKVISFIGYNYYQRNNSLMRTNSYSKKIQKMENMLVQADNLKFLLKPINNTDRIESFINNSLIYYSTTLEKKDYKKYNKILKEKHCFDLIDGSSLKKKIKKFIIKNNSWLFYHVFVR